MLADPVLGITAVGALLAVVLGLFGFGLVIAVCVGVLAAIQAVLPATDRGADEVERAQAVAADRDDAAEPDAPVGEGTAGSDPAGDG
ncbi:MAG: hypothetical protein E6J14_01515 [Chloroflexi bacterium]|nr:MAG: hypothetical protein E6J14_01515 [Chloroflexota bacterium]